MELKEKIMTWLNKTKGLAAFYPSAVSKMFGCTEAEAITALMELSAIVEHVYEIVCPECYRRVREVADPFVPAEDPEECICGNEFYHDIYNKNLIFKVKRKTV